MSNIVDQNLHPLLTIGDLASHVGLKPATLRMWEHRHGFPEPERLPSGHRRYPATMVAEVRSVLERQHAGLTLAAAIAAVRAESVDTAIDSSVFAAVAAVCDRDPIHLSRRAMLAFSRAIEDACAASGGSAVIIGCFQREAVYRACEQRWRELARGARACVVLADFATPSGTGAAGSVMEVPITAGSPLHREWAVAVATPTTAACVAGWEWPGGNRFEALWSIEPAAARAAIERAFEVARATVPRCLPDVVALPDLPSATDDGATMRLMDRVLARLDR